MMDAWDNLSTSTKRLIQYLSENRYHVKAASIADHLNLSERSVYYALSKANAFLKEQELPEIINDRQLGYFLPQTAADYFKLKIADADSSDLSKENRQAEIVWKLINDEDQLSINRLSEYFAVSRNTVIKDFKDLELAFPQLKLVSTVKGKTAACSEETKRRIFISLLDQSVHIAQKADLLCYQDQKLKEVEEQFEDSSGLNLIEDSRLTLLRYLKFVQLRAKENKLIQETSAEPLDMATAFPNLVQAADTMLDKLGVRNVNETIFLCKLVLSLQTSSSTPMPQDLKAKMDKVTASIINRYNQLAGTAIASSSFKELLQNHLYATYFRCLFDFPFTASALQKVEHNYPETVRFVKLACQPLADLIGHDLPKNEIILITTYFISFDEPSELRTVTDEELNLKDALDSDVLVACSSGVGTSAMLYMQLKQQYPLIKFSKSLDLKELKTVVNKSDKAKLIITTSRIDHRKFDIPLVYVHPILTNTDQEQIFEALAKYLPNMANERMDILNGIVEVVERHSNVTDSSALLKDLNHFLYPDLPENDEANELLQLLPVKNILVVDQELEWHKAIKLACSLLERDGAVEHRYADNIIHLVEKYGPYMLLSSNVFLAHAAPDQGAVRLGISMIVSRPDININVNGQEEDINIMMVLSPGYHHEQDRALNELLDVASDRQFIKELISVSDPIEVRMLLTDFLRKESNDVQE